MKKVNWLCASSLILMIACSVLSPEPNQALAANPSTLVYEDYGPTGITLLPFTGVQSMINGSITNTGPTWQAPGGFPYVLFDQNRNLLLLHPGTFETKDHCASVALQAANNGFYVVSGAFARANNFRNAGDGVQVKIFTNLNENSPIFKSTISSDHDVDADKPFNGTGVVRFRFITRLSAGDMLRFVVCSGPQKLDGTFDVTALNLSITTVF